MAWLAVDKDGLEIISQEKLTREVNQWRDEFEVSGQEYDVSVGMPKGSIEKLIGRKLTWDDEPVELKDES